MGILSGPEIVDQVNAGRIIIDPFDEENVGPNSYDLRLGPNLLIYGNSPPETYVNQLTCLDVREDNPTVGVVIPADGKVLEPGVLYLGSTIEKAGSDHYVPCIEGRSSMARLGISMHVTAGFGDHGFKYVWTLEITVVHPVRVYPGMRCCQIVFHNLIGVRQPYRGKYVDADGTIASKSHEDFV